MVRCALCCMDSCHFGHARSTIQMNNGKSGIEILAAMFPIVVIRSVCIYTKVSEQMSHRFSARSFVHSTRWQTVLSAEKGKTRTWIDFLSFYLKLFLQSSVKIVNARQKMLLSSGCHSCLHWLSEWFACKCERIEATSRKAREWIICASDWSPHYNCWSMWVKFIRTPSWTWSANDERAAFAERIHAVQVKKILFNQGRPANVFEKQSSIFIVKNEKSTTVSLWLSFRSGETSSDRRLYLVNVIRGRVEGKFSRDMGETSAVEHRREQAKEQWVKRK